jgi:CBS domain-containing protein
VIKRLSRAASIEDLARLRTEGMRSVLRLVEQGVRAAELLDVMTEINDQLTARLIRLVESNLRQTWKGAIPELPWVWMMLGSEGRREQSLRTDQDNAIIYADPSTKSEGVAAEKWFGALATDVNDALSRCGYALCPGEVMARNPRWRQPLSGWKRTFRQWVLTPDPSALMHASVFFDLRAGYGDRGLLENLQADLLEGIGQEPGFLGFLMRSALDYTPPLSFFRRFVVERGGEHSGSFDIKRRGLMPVVGIARVMALDVRYLDSTNTFDRLEYVVRTQPRLATSAENVLEAYQYLVDLRLKHHLDAFSSGQSPDNYINPEALTRTQRRILRSVFSVVSDAQESLGQRYGAGMIRT